VYLTEHLQINNFHFLITTVQILRHGYQNTLSNSACSLKWSQGAPCFGFSCIQFYFWINSIDHVVLGVPAVELDPDPLDFLAGTIRVAGVSGRLAGFLLIIAEPHNFS